MNSYLISFKRVLDNTHVAWNLLIKFRVDSFLRIGPKMLFQAQACADCWPRKDITCDARQLWESSLRSLTLYQHLPFAINIPNTQLPPFLNSLLFPPLPLSFPAPKTLTGKWARRKDPPTILSSLRNDAASASPVLVSPLNFDFQSYFSVAFLNHFHVFFLVDFDFGAVFFYFGANLFVLVDLGTDSGVEAKDCIKIYLGTIGSYAHLLGLLY